MNLQYDRRLTISIGNSRKDMSWKAQTLSIGELWEKLRIPVRGTETVAQYMKLKKAQQDELKDVGGFVAGTLKGARRKAANITGRDVVTLDFDTVPAYGTEGLIESVRKMGCAFAVYSTRKHIETAPRLRILFPILFALMTAVICSMIAGSLPKIPGRILSMVLVSAQTMLAEVQLVEMNATK